MKRALIPVIAGVALLLPGIGIAAAADTCEYSDEYASRLHLAVLGDLLGDDDENDGGLLDLASVVRSTHEHTEPCED